MLVCKNSNKKNNCIIVYLYTGRMKYVFILYFQVRFEMHRHIHNFIIFFFSFIFFALLEVFAYDHKILLGKGAGEIVSQLNQKKKKRKKDICRMLLYFVSTCIRACVVLIYAYTKYVGTSYTSKMRTWFFTSMPILDTFFCTECIVDRPLNSINVYVGSRRLFHN